VDEVDWRVLQFIVATISPPFPLDDALEVYVRLQDVSGSSRRCDATSRSSTRIVERVQGTVQGLELRIRLGEKAKKLREEGRREPLPENDSWRLASARRACLPAVRHPKGRIGSAGAAHRERTSNWDLQAVQPAHALAGEPPDEERCWFWLETFGVTRSALLVALSERH